MRTYTFKSIAQRGTLLTTAAVLAAATLLPAQLAFADALNPLTDRSLTLSSSSPGWSHTDGSENPTYAPPNSGANGQKTGNTFSFKTSTADDIKAFTFQYCITPAGTCENPGNDKDNGGTRGTDTATTSDLNVEAPSPAEVPNASFGTIVDTSAISNPTSGVVKAVPGYAGYDNGKPGAGHETGIGGAGAAVTGNFVVYYYNTGTSAWVQSEGWDMAATANASPAPNANNYITLSNTSGNVPATAGMAIKVVFFGTTNNYITNPGAGAFFVRMNSYSDAAATTILDGGVTVANVMNQSIWIQTKVLETMQFSVGTVDPNTLDSSDGDATPGSEAPSTLEKALYASASDPLNPDTYKGDTLHGICDQVLGNITPLQTTNVLKLGNQTAESSLETDKTYSTHSYWKLSSNSSAGATVYYSGHTLTNTVGDEIKAIGPTKLLPTKGSEQFGLALDNTDLTGTSVADLKVSYDQEVTYENGNDNYNQASPTTGPITRGTHPSTVTDVNGNASWHDPTLYPLLPALNYNEGTGAINAGNGAKFAFVRTSDTIPEPIASENSQVVDCVTGKMRYIANIAATTPAGIYTTKVNYIAAPQY